MEFPPDYKGGLDSGNEIKNILDKNENYLIITKTDKSELQKMINYLMTKNYFPNGSISCSGDNRRIYYTQAMLKKDINENNLIKLLSKNNFLLVFILALLFKKNNIQMK